MTFGDKKRIFEVEKLCIFSAKFCGIIKFREGHFSWNAQFLQVRGDIISCFILIYLQNKISLYYSYLIIRGGC